jgi:hypothetical protein
VRQKPVLDELAEFSSWYEKEYAKYCEENNIPEAEREELGLVNEIAQAKLKEKERDKASGIECGSLSEAKRKKEALLELTDFPFSNLVKEKPETWFNILSFFGIDFSFPSDYLYRHKDGTAKNIVLLNKGLHEFMAVRKKFKLNVVNLGLRIFQKNKGTKSEGEYRLM